MLLLYFLAYQACRDFSPLGGVGIVQGAGTPFILKCPCYA